MSLRFTIEHPLGGHDCAPELYQQEGMAAFARAAEEAGFDAIAFTEHPAPSLKWLQSGGHESMDPLAALAFVAAVTTKIRLMTYLLVLPYRNPLLVAKSIATVDLLSTGRVTVGAGGGYLRSEFGTLGVDYEERGALFDEALDVLRALWTQESLSSEGRHFTARNAVSVPAPVQLPHPPIWIGGTGKAARRRVARAGDGWMPLLLTEEVAQTTGMQAMTTPADLAAAVEDLHALLAEAGREPSSVAVQLQSQQSSFLVDRTISWDEHHDFLGQIAAAGATDAVVRVPAGSVSEAVDALHEYGRDGIAASRR